MKKAIIFLVIGMGLAFGQSSSQDFAVGSPPPTNITGVSYTNYTQPGGGNTIYYWLITNYAGGSVLDTNPQRIDNVNVNDPSVGHPISVSWNGVQGVVGYSLLKTATNVSPTFPCTCLVATVLAPIGFVSDIGAALTLISPTFTKPATGSIRLNNTLYNPPIFETVVNGLPSSSVGPLTATYLVAPTTSTAIQRLNGAAKLIDATPGVDYYAPGTPISSFDLPFPSGAAKGGILSTLCSAGLVASGYDTTGNPVCVSSSASTGYTIVPFSATPTFTATGASSNSFIITLTGNVTSSTLAGAALGQILTFDICQDGSGGHTLVWPTNVSNPATVSLLASVCTSQIFVYDGVNAIPVARDYVTGTTVLTATTTKSGAILLNGLTSGGVALTVDDIAGTAITYVLPSTNGSAGQALLDNGVITCPTLATGIPTTCHQLIWGVGLALNVAGTATLGTGSLSANTCASAVTVAATGVLTSDTITWTPTVDISGATGYTPGGTLRIYPYPTAGNVNFKVCNGDPSNAVTPGAVTLNWRVIR